MAKKEMPESVATKSVEDKPVEITAPKKERKSEKKTNKTGVTTATKLNLRTTPVSDKIDNIAGTIPAGTEVEIIDEVGLFYSIRLNTDEKGVNPLYVMKAFVDIRK